MSQDIVKPIALRVMAGGVHEAVHGRIVRVGGICAVAIRVTLIPRWAGILGACRLVIKGGYCGAIVVHVRRICGGPVKRCAICRLRVVVLRPIVRQVAKVVVKGAVLLRYHDDVIDRSNSVRLLGKGCRNTRIGSALECQLTIRTSAIAAEAAEGEPGCRSGGQADAGAASKTCSAG